MNRQVGEGCRNGEDGWTCVKCVYNDTLEDSKQMRMTEDRRGAFRAAEWTFYLLHNTNSTLTNPEKKPKGD